MSPEDSLHFIERYSIVLLPVLTVTEQIGIPLPAVPALLAVGALAATGRASIPPLSLKTPAAKLHTLC